MGTKYWVTGGLFVAMSVACDGRSETASEHSVGRGPGGAVVARVDGEPIGLSEVAKVCEETGLTPEEALSRLIDERLLAQYAASRGFGELRATAREVERARARAVLIDAVENDPNDSVERRREKLNHLLSELRSKTKVVLDEERVRTLLADDSLLGSGT